MIASRLARVRRSARRVLVAVGVGAVAFLVWERLTFDREEWIADYEQLRAHVSVHYANLLWVIDQRQLDPVALDRETMRRLHEADTDREARAAIASFVEAFDDGHFRVHRIKLSKRLEAWWAELWADDVDAASLRSDTPGADACTALGFHEDQGGLAFGLAEAPEFTPLSANDRAFGAGLLALDEHRFGILRIPSFDQHRYRSACIRAWERSREDIEGECTEECTDDFVHRRVPNLLLADLSATVDALQQEGIEALVVDVTHNGGGTGWVDPAARILSSKPLPCPRLAFIRHPHWSDRLAGVLHEVEEDLRGEHPPEDRVLLQQARDRLQRLVAEARETCDLGSIWTDPARPACTNLVEDEYYACGVFPHLPPGSLAGAKTRGDLFKPLGYDYEPGRYDGPLHVLVDDHTGSASEHFAGMLADGEAARLHGLRTVGSGCGYTNGGVPALLRYSELRIDMPDCQRRRKDGTNELAGIEPHVPIDWQPGDELETQRRKLFEALRSR